MHISLPHMQVHALNSAVSQKSESEVCVCVCEEGYFRFLLKVFGLILHCVCLSLQNTANKTRDCLYKYMSGKP